MCVACSYLSSIGTSLIHLERQPPPPHPFGPAHCHPLRRTLSTVRLPLSAVGVANVRDVQSQETLTTFSVKRSGSGTERSAGATSGEPARHGSPGRRRT